VIVLDGTIDEKRNQKIYDNLEFMNYDGDGNMEQFFSSMQLGNMS